MPQVCPMLDNGEKNTYACCSIKQLKSLENSLRLSKVILLRCPSCADNFAHLHCINTCSPNQTQTVEVTKVMDITTSQNTMATAVVAYKAFISTTFADSAFGSCKNVRIPATGGFAIGTMCGPYGAAQCTPQYWYDFQGDSSNGLAPLDIDFKLINEGNTTGLPTGVVPYNGRALKCNETTPTGGEACSCQDCTESCQMIQISPTTSPFTLLGADGYLVVSIILFCLLTFAFLLYLFVACFLRSRRNRKDEEKGRGKGRGKDQNSNDVSQPLIDPSEVTCTDRNSLVAQAFLSSKFQFWGTLMATFPLTVSIFNIHKQI